MPICPGCLRRWTSNKRMEEPMTRDQYRQELERCKLTQENAGKLFGGVQQRAAARWATAEGTVPHSVALVIALMQVCRLMPNDLKGLVAAYWGNNPKTKERKVDTLRGKIRQALGPRRLTDLDEDVNLQKATAAPENVSHPLSSSAIKDQDGPKRGLFAGF
jgi:hypothetical protein